MDLWQCPAVVTGAASGLGAETARHLAEAGAKVTAVDIDAVRVGVVGDAIDGLAIPCDVSDAAAAEAAFQRARDMHGPARVLVNCVGVAHPQRILGDGGPMPLDDFRRLVEVNLISTFNMMRLAAADMARLKPTPSGERGVIISTASTSAYEGQSGEAAYAASKGGVVGMIYRRRVSWARTASASSASHPACSVPPPCSLWSATSTRASSIPYPFRRGSAILPSSRCWSCM